MSEYRRAEFGEAAVYALLGFLIVFLGIVFLIFIIWAVGQIMTSAKKKPNKAQEKPAISVQESSSKQNDDEMSEELIAVITAAIAAYYQQENKKCDFTVKRIKRI